MAKSSISKPETSPLIKAILGNESKGKSRPDKRKGEIFLQFSDTQAPQRESAGQAKSNEPQSLSKSFLELLNGQKGSIERLAFEAEPNLNNKFYALYHDKVKLIPDKILKRLAIQDDLVASIVLARSHQMAAFANPREDRFSTGFLIEPKKGIEVGLDKDKKEALRQRIDEAVRKIWTCGSTEGWDDQEQLTFSGWMIQSVRNAIVVGRLATEIIFTDSATGDKKFHSFRPIDAGTIYKATPQKEGAEQVRREARRLLEQIKNKHLEPEKFENDEYAWVQVIEGQPRQAFTAKECLVHNFYPVADVELDGYPVTPLDTVIAAVTTHINITTWNKLYFQNGRAARGMLVIQSDDVDEHVINRVRQNFMASINNVSNCLAGSTGIISDVIGRTTIEEYLNGQKERPIRLWTGTKWEDGLVYETGPKTLTETVTSNGITLRMSPDHRVLVIGEDTEPCWREQKALKIGDWVFVNKKSSENPGASWKLDGEEIDEEMAEVLGWVTGDGSITDRGMVLYYHHEKEVGIRERHFEILKKWRKKLGFNLEKKDIPVSEEEQAEIKERYGFHSVAPIRLQIVVNDMFFARKLLEAGLSLSRDGKDLPSILYCLSDRFKAAFLRGFFGADGNCQDHRTPKITIASGTIREQTKQLLLSMGIRTALSEGKTKLVIKGKKREYIEGKSYLHVKDKALFHEKIGFPQLHKQPRKITRPEGMNDRVLRALVVKYAKLLRQITKYTPVFDKNQRKNLTAIVSGGESCTLARLKRYFAMAGMIEKLPAWLFDYQFEQVVSTVNTGKTVTMYDISVNDDLHRMCTDGIITHNSHRMPVFGIGPDDSITWQPIDSGARDAEFQYLSDMNARVILSAFQMSPEELPGYTYLSRGTNSQALSEGNREYQMEAARDLGIRPLIKQFEDFLNSRILPLIDPKLAELCVVRLSGLDADTPEKEAVRIQQDMQVHLTYNEILNKVEKKPIDKKMGADLPLSPAYQAVLDKYLTVGQILEYFLGIEGASKDPQWAYVRDPFWFQAVQMQMQQQQMQMQQQQMQQQQAQGGQGGPPPEEGGGGGGEAPPEESQGQAQGGAQQGQGQPVPTEKQKTQAVEQSSASGALGKAIDDAMSALSKSEKNMKPGARRVLAQQNKLVDRFIKAFEDDMRTATKEILKVATHHTPKK